MPTDNKFFVPTEFVTIRELAERTLLDSNMAFRPGHRARQFRVTTISALETAFAMESSKDKNGIYLHTAKQIENLPEIDKDFINDFSILSDDEKLSLKIIVKKLAAAANPKNDILNKVIGEK